MVHRFWEESGALIFFSVCVPKRMTTCIPAETQPVRSLPSYSYCATIGTLDQHKNLHTGPRWRLHWVLQPLLVLSLISCATDNKQTNASQETRSHQLRRESTFQSAWVGKRYDSLLEAFGEPKVHLNILGYRPLKTSLAVYGVLDHSSNCVDAFTMVKLEDTGEWVVADYFCR